MNISQSPHNGRASSSEESGASSEGSGAFSEETIAAAHARRRNEVLAPPGSNVHRGIVFSKEMRISAEIRAPFVRVTQNRDAVRRRIRRRGDMVLGRLPTTPNARAFRDG